MDSTHSCTLYTLKKDYLLEKSKQECTENTQTELITLFENSHAGAVVRPDAQTLEQLKKLGYIGDNE